MNDVIGRSGIVEGVSTNKTQSEHMERANTYDFSQYPQGKLQNFLKTHLQSLGVAQIMIGLQYFIFVIIQSIFTLSPPYRGILSCFYLGYPFYATVFFIISGSLTITAARKYTKCLIVVNIGANIFSTVLSIMGTVLLSLNLIDILLFPCPELYECALVKSFAISIVILQMVVSCTQLAISFLLSVATYNVSGNNVSWVSVLGCWIKSDSEDPYQGLLTRPEVYDELAVQDTNVLDCNP